MTISTRRWIVGIPCLHGPTRTWSHHRRRELPPLFPSFHISLTSQHYLCCATVASAASARLSASRRAMQW